MSEPEMTFLGWHYASWRYLANLFRQATESNEEPVTLRQRGYDFKLSVTRCGRRYRKKQSAIVYARGPLILGETVFTANGPVMAQPGDYVLSSEEGDTWPCNGAVFANTYEEVP